MSIGLHSEIQVSVRHLDFNIDTIWRFSSEYRYVGHLAFSRRILFYFCYFNFNLSSHLKRIPAHCEKVLISAADEVVRVMSLNNSFEILIVSRKI